MSISGVNNTSVGSSSVAAAATSSSSANNSSFSITKAITGGAGGELGKDQFLELLVTELKYQDPLKPKDDKSFIAELAQFSSLEQTTNSAKALNDLISLQKNKPDYSYLNFIGKKVEYTYTYTDPNTQDTKLETSTGVISSIRLKDGNPEFYVGDTKINLSDINQIIY
jgi:flagellar basal-body rod modification protein FlgD